MLTGVLAGDGGDLSRQQAQRRAVLVGRPHPAVAPQEGCASALLAAEPHGSVLQAGHEPLESDGHLDQLPTELGGHPVDHAAAHQSLADPGSVAPAAAGGEQVPDRHGQVVVRVHETARRRHDAVPVRIGVVAERDVEVVLQRDEVRHGVRGRAVHADLAVPVQGHEAERGVDPFVHHGEVEPVTFGDCLPVGEAGAAQRIDPDPHTCRAHGVEVDQRGQVVHVAAEEVVGAGRRRPARPLERHAPDLGEARGQQFVRPVLHAAGDVGVGWAAVGRVVVEAPVLRRIVRRRDHDPVRQPGLAPRVVPQDGVRQGGCWGVAAGAVQQHVHLVGGQHLQGRDQRRLGQGVAVEP